MSHPVTEHVVRTRRHCTDLTEVVVESGHWMAQEKPVSVNAALARFLATKLQSAWTI